MPRGISGGNQVIKFANMNKSQSSLFILLKRDDDLLVMQNDKLDFRQVLCPYCLL